MRTSSTDPAGVGFVPVRGNVFCCHYLPPGHFTTAGSGFNQVVGQGE